MTQNQPQRSCEDPRPNSRTARTSPGASSAGRRPEERQETSGDPDTPVWSRTPAPARTTDTSPGAPVDLAGPRQHDHAPGAVPVALASPGVSTSKPTPPTQQSLSAHNLRVGYGERVVLQDLDVAITPGSFTVIIGPNACGKSTLLRALARLLSPTAGHVLLDGRDLARTPTKELSRRVGVLPQSSSAPDGITVVDLVSRGRHPHQSLLRRWSQQDEHAVRKALEDTALTDLAHRHVEELSGGQRQRVWIAMALAQETPLLLLDEPTTYLDIAHQLEVLDLCQAMHRRGRTLVAVLHDLNQAARYATHLIAMKDGHIVAQGHPDEVVTVEYVQTIFGVRARILQDPESGRPMVIPRYTPASAP